RGGEIPVRPAAGTAFAELLPKLASYISSLTIKTRNLVTTFQRRPVEPAARLDGRPLVDGPESAERRLDLRRRRRRRHAHVDDGMRLVRDDVRPQPAAHLHDVDGDAA